MTMTADVSREPERKVCPVSFPSPRENPFAPPGAYRPQGHDGAPFKVQLAYGGEAWLVTRHADVRSLLGDSRMSSDATADGYPLVPLAYRQQRPGVFLSMDPPEHERYRGLLSREFSAAAVSARRSDIQKLADRLVDRMSTDGTRSADLVKEFSDLLPCYVAGSLFGVGWNDEDFVRHCIQARATHDASMARRLAAGEQMKRFLGALIEARAQQPGDDVLSRLVANAEGRGISREEVVGAATLLLAASLDATSAVTTLTVLSILRDEQLAALVRNEPGRWAQPAVEESLRYWSVIQHGPVRVAKEDLEIGGRTIRAGDFVLLHLHSANWDPAVFDHPADFDVSRDSRAHLALGYGVHRCLGGGLGQLEATVAVETLFTRLPEMRLAIREDDLVYREEDLVYGVRRLPISW